MLYIKIYHILVSQRDDYMLLLRALNEYDILSDPSTNGIASKEMIYNLVKSYYENIKDKEYINLSSKEKETFIREHIKEYLISHRHKLEKLYNKRNALYRKTINDLLYNHNPAGVIMFKKYMSSLQSHLNSGSRINSNWISTSKSFASIKKYYDKQSIHKVALIFSNTNGIIDSDRILTVDVSTDENIKNNSYLYNKINCNDLELLTYLSEKHPTIIDFFDTHYTFQTNPKATGFKYAKSSSEVCIYEYLPASHIIGLIEAIQMDLITMEVFNFDYFKLDKKEQEIYLKTLKNMLLKAVKYEKDAFLLHVYEELYLNNRNINELVTFSDSREKIIANRNKILRLARVMPNIQIK